MSVYEQTPPILSSLVDLPKVPMLSYLPPTWSNRQKRLKSETELGKWVSVVLRLEVDCWEEFPRQISRSICKALKAVLKPKMSASCRVGECPPNASPNETKHKQKRHGVAQKASSFFRQTQTHVLAEFHADSQGSEPKNRVERRNDPCLGSFCFVLLLNRGPGTNKQNCPSPCGCQEN